MVPPQPEPPVNTRRVRAAAPPVRRQMLTTLSALARKTGLLDPGVIENWEEIVGPELFKLCRPVRIRKQKNVETLVVAVPNGAAAMRVQYTADRILARAQSYLGRHALKKLAIEQTGATADRKPRWRSQHVVTAPKRPKTLAKTTADNGEAKTLDEALDRLRKAVQEGHKR